GRVQPSLRRLRQQLAPHRGSLRWRGQQDLRLLGRCPQGQRRQRHGRDRLHRRQPQYRRSALRQVHRRRPSVCRQALRRGNNRHLRRRQRRLRRRRHGHHRGGGPGQQRQGPLLGGQERQGEPRQLHQHGGVQPRTPAQDQQAERHARDLLQRRLPRPDQRRQRRLRLPRQPHHVRGHEERRQSRQLEARDLQARRRRPRLAMEAARERPAHDHDHARHLRHRRPRRQHLRAAQERPIPLLYHPLQRLQAHAEGRRSHGIQLRRHRFHGARHRQARHPRGP
ncbi:uncharacterized protein METZ01_LOCUS407242, partial [marine metagenome]